MTGRRNARPRESALGVGLDRFAGAGEVAVAPDVVDAADRRPELVVLEPRRREGGVLARVGVLPGVGGDGLGRVRGVAEGALLGAHAPLLDLAHLVADGD